MKIIIKERNIMEIIIHASFLFQYGFNYEAFDKPSSINYCDFINHNYEIPDIPLEKSNKITSFKINAYGWVTIYV